MKDIDKDELFLIAKAAHDINAGYMLNIQVNDRIKVYKVPQPKNPSKYTIRVDIKVSI